MRNKLNAFYTMSSANVLLSAPPEAFAPLPPNAARLSVAENQ